MSSEPPAKRAKMTTPITDAQIAAIKALALVNGDEEELTVQTIAPLARDRHAIYAAGLPDSFPAVGDGDRSAASVHCITEDDEACEHIVIVTLAAPITAVPVIFEDKILYDEVPLSGIIEYRFASDKPWMLGTISQGSLEFYRSSKFKIWKDLLMTGGGGCKRTFKSMLNTGLVTSIYDHVSFPSPADEQPDWEVEDENTGKMVAIPRPVSSIRIWDPEEKKYEALSSRMEGAPEEAAEAEFWATTLAELKEAHGADQVDELM